MRAFAWFLGLMVVALAAVALFAWPAWTLLHPHFDFPFHRIGERVGMLALLLGFVALARHLGLSDRASLGYGEPRSVFVREMSLALVLGVVTMLGVVGIMAALGLLEWRADAPSSAAALAKLLLTRALSGFAVAFIEETFLRGAMHTAIERESGTRAAVLLTALLYAATHFFASFHIPPDRVTPWSGVQLLGGTLHAFAHPLAIADAFLALFAVGVVLATVPTIRTEIGQSVGLITPPTASSQPNPGGGSQGLAGAGSLAGTASGQTTGPAPVTTCPSATASSRASASPTVKKSSSSTPPAVHSTASVSNSATGTASPSSTVTVTASPTVTVTKTHTLTPAPRVTVTVTATATPTGSCGSTAPRPTAAPATSSKPKATKASSSSSQPASTSGNPSQTASTSSAGTNNANLTAGSVSSAESPAGP